MSASDPRPRRRAPKPGVLVQRFGAPPFSVLDARQGYWRARKEAWLRLGVHESGGRGSNLSYGPSSQPGHVYTRKQEAERLAGQPLTWRAFMQAHPDCGALDQTSRFDPVLAELAYAWFSPPGGLVLDPFAGGSVRGLVAGMLGRPYVGYELRPEQVASNEQAADQANLTVRPSWSVGDARDLLPTAPPVDLIFSCPPYGDLEVYSDDPRDLSRMTWAAFSAAYREIVAGSVAALRQDRFVAFVVGDVRDRQGLYRGLPALTVAAFADAGAQLYNEAVIVTPAGSLPMRAGKTFTASRKLSMAHQWLLVFVKGNPRRAAEAAGSVVLFNLEAAA